MTNDFEVETDASVDVTTSPINIQLFDGEANLYVNGPKRMTEDARTTFHFGVDVDAEELQGDNIEDTWAHFGFNLSPEEAKELGEFLLDHHDEEPDVAFPSEMWDE